MLRTAQERDHAALLDLMAEFNRAERIAMRRETTGPALHKLLADESLGKILVLEDDGLVGYAVVTWGFDLEFGGRDAFLTEIFVRPEARRIGQGRKLLEGVMTAAKAAGAHAIHLGVYPDNQGALSLYRAAGFSRLPRDFYSRSL
jgi:ribosomal protein S18 acetylase RimI-like enzyme